MCKLKEKVSRIKEFKEYLELGGSKLIFVQGRTRWSVRTGGTGGTPAFCFGWMGELERRLILILRL